MYSSLDASFKQTASNPGIGGSANTGAELEEFKRVLVETNIFLLGTTFIVSILHTIFEMLAFKNDISHWRNKKDNVGISVRTILANVFMQAVIFLYLLDNSDGTSWMILAGQGFGILLEAWKITRMVNVRVQHVNSFIPYRVIFEDKHKLSNLEKETKEYDEEAFKYLYWVAVPLLLAYAVYSVLYDTHKSWYSFIITTLVGSVYAYGFLMMVPSLYINYRLKSVAHMPRKTMIYKLLNTFVTLLHYIPPLLTITPVSSTISLRLRSRCPRSTDSRHLEMISSISLRCTKPGSTGWITDVSTSSDREELTMMRTTRRRLRQRRNLRAPLLSGRRQKRAEQIKAGRPPRENR